MLLGRQQPAERRVRRLDEHRAAVSQGGTVGTPAVLRAERPDIPHPGTDESGDAVIDHGRIAFPWS